MTRLGFPNLGIPYWDWTQDQRIPTLFDNLNQKIPSIVDIARGFDQRGGLEEWRVDGIPLQFLTSDDQYYTVVPDGNPRVMLINWTKFLSCNKDPECSITIRSNSNLTHIYNTYQLKKDMYCTQPKQHK